MTEEQMQAKCILWFDETYPEHRNMLFAVPNGGERPKRLINGKWVDVEGNKMKASGVRRGVSDLIFVVETAVYFIEAKIPGGVHSEFQINFSCEVEDRGHKYLTFYTIGEFQVIINSIILKHYAKLGR